MQSRPTGAVKEIYMQTKYYVILECGMILYQSVEINKGR